MTVLHRTDLTTSQKIECAAAAVARQHEHGAKTALSERYEISRPTVYAVGATAESVLRTHFEAPLLGGAGVDVRVDDAQLRRAVVALRVVAPNAIRPIEDLLPVLYPGVKVSYGTIQALLVEAEGRAARFNAHSALDAVQAGALDEMFSQGEPVLAGVDLDTGYLFGLSLSPTRDAGAWAGVLREGQGQGLALSVVVKDAARGIAAGVAEVFPCAEQRDDCFHVLYEMHKVRRKLERRAYAAIEREGEALGRLGRIRARDKTCRRKAKCALGKARRQCTEAIERFDVFEAAMDTVRGALECIDVASAELHRPEQVEAWIAQAGGAHRGARDGRVREACTVSSQPRAGSGAGTEERAAPTRGAGRAVVTAGGALGMPVLVLGQGARQATFSRPQAGAVLGICSAPTGHCKTGSAPRARRCSLPSRRCCTSAIALRAPSRGSMRHCVPISTCTRASPRAFSTCSVPGSICAPGAGDGTRGPVPTSV